MPSSDESLLAEQAAYYSALAGEYHEHSIDQPGEHELMAAIDAFQPTGDVLELACGTGRVKIVRKNLCEFLDLGFAMRGSTVNLCKLGVESFSVLASFGLSFSLSFSVLASFGLSFRSCRLFSGLFFGFQTNSRLSFCTNGFGFCACRFD